MYETNEGYIFTTFQDGNVIFYKDRYNEHCCRHDAIKGTEGRKNIQNALDYPHIITTYPFKNISGKTVAHCKKYRKITNRKIITTRGNEWECWEVIIRKNIGKRKKIVTAYLTSSPQPFVINDRIEKPVFIDKSFISNNT